MVDISSETEVAFRIAASIENPRVRFPGFNPSETILPAGTILREGARKLTCDIMVQRDVAVRLRDGKVLYADVFRPTNMSPVPVLVAWSPYGKQGGFWKLEDLPARMGVKRSLLSELQKWEAPDPALWCAAGYAVVNPDSRGAFMSEGDAHTWGPQEGRDGADVVDWIGSQQWCNGKVGMAGNSWLAAAQWYIAAERPRHLAAIAPWEGFDDPYRDLLSRGGIPDPGFMEHILEFLAGRGMIEDLPAMLKRYPAMNRFWEERAAKIEQIEVPAYVVASWSNMAHTFGTFDAYSRLQCPKWLRVHDTQEWPDFYAPEHQEDLRRFFDRYLKEQDTGWEATPPVRLSIFSAGPDGATVTDRAESEFPLSRVRYRKLYLDGTAHILSSTPPEDAAAVRQEANSPAQIIFKHKFATTQEWVGHCELVLHVEVQDADDCDIFAHLRKRDRDGQIFQALSLPGEVEDVRLAAPQLQALADTPMKDVLFYEGPWGRLRASHRQIDERRSVTGRPVHTHRNPIPLSAGEVAEIRISLSPTAMEFKAGETLELILSSQNLTIIPFATEPPAVLQKGIAVIHMGSGRLSYLNVPVSYDQGEQSGT